MNDRALDEAGMPKLPEGYRPVPVGQVVMWVWATTTTLVLAVVLILGAVGWHALTATAQALGGFVGEAGCSAYWSFVLDAKQAGLDAEQIEGVYSELGATDDFTVTEACGSVADVYATLP